MDTIRNLVNDFPHIFQSTPILPNQKKTEEKSFPLFSSYSTQLPVGKMQHRLGHQLHETPQSSSPKYFCTYCDPSPINFWHSYNTVEKVHAHWLSNHTELPVAKPFQFYAIELLACAYCKCSGTFKYIKTHHQKNHENMPFIVMRQRNAEQCAMCLYHGPDLINHFQRTHTAFASSDDIVFNPICFTPEFLAEMLQNNIHQRFQCGHCGDTFETDHETRWHCCEKHGNLKHWQVVQQQSVPNYILHVICSICGAEIQSNDLLNHMVTESQASGHGIDQLYIDYMKLKVVFANGLTVFKQNVACSAYDDSNQIVQLFQNGPSNIHE